MDNQYPLVGERAGDDAPGYRAVLSENRVSVLSRGVPHHGRG